MSGVNKGMWGRPPDKGGDKFLSSSCSLTVRNIQRLVGLGIWGMLDRDHVTCSSKYPTGRSISALRKPNPWNQTSISINENGPWPLICHDNCTINQHPANPTRVRVRSHVGWGRRVHTTNTNTTPHLAVRDHIRCDHGSAY